MVSKGTQLNFSRDAVTSFIPNLSSTSKISSPVNSDLPYTFHMNGMIDYIHECDGWLKSPWTMRSDDDKRMYKLKTRSFYAYLISRNENLYTIWLSELDVRFKYAFIRRVSELCPGRHFITEDGHDIITPANFKGKEVISLARPIALSSTMIKCILSYILSCDSYLNVSGESWSDSLGYDYGELKYINGVVDHYRWLVLHFDFLIDMWYLCEGKHNKGAFIGALATLTPGMYFYTEHMSFVKSHGDGIVDISLLPKYYAMDSDCESDHQDDDADNSVSNELEEIN